MLSPAVPMPGPLLGHSLDLCLPQASLRTIIFIFLEEQSKALSMDMYRAGLDLQAKDTDKEP